MEFFRRFTKKSETPPGPHVPADPTRSSRVVIPGASPGTAAEPLTVGKRNSYDNVVLNDSVGGKLHVITDQEVQFRRGEFDTMSKREDTQIVVSMLLKGFLNIASAVPLPEGYRTYPDNRKVASYEAPAQDLPPNPDGNDAIEADSELLSLLFGDDEHTLTDKRLKGEPRNIQIEKDGRYMLYDFDRAASGFWNPNPPSIDVYRDDFKPRTVSRRSLEIMEDKLAKMSAFYSGKEGREHIEAIIQRAGKPIDKIFFKSTPDYQHQDYGNEEFIEEFISRINRTLKSVRDKLKE